MAGDTRFSEALKYEATLLHQRGYADDAELQDAFNKAFGEANMAHFEARCHPSDQPWNDVTISCKNISSHRNNTILASIIVQRITSHTSEGVLVRERYEFSLNLYYTPKGENQKIITSDVPLLDSTRIIARLLSEHIDTQIERITKEIDRRELAGEETWGLCEDLKWFWVNRLGLSDY